MITNHCPHFEDTPVGKLCERCEQEGVGIVELDADDEGIVTFLVPISQGLTLQELRSLLSQETQDETLIRRKLMTKEELEEAMLEPYEVDPEAAEEDALEEELAWKLNLLMTDLMGDLWGRGTLYVVPERSESSRGPVPCLERDLRRCVPLLKGRQALARSPSVWEQGRVKIPGPVPIHLSEAICWFCWSVIELVTLRPVATAGAPSGTPAILCYSAIEIPSLLRLRGSADPGVHPLQDAPTVLIPGLVVAQELDVLGA